MTNTVNVSKQQLQQFVERIEKLEEEKAATSMDIKDVYTEAAGNGFDKKALKSIVRLRRLDASERKEADLILETYLTALGMV